MAVEIKIRITNLEQIRAAFQRAPAHMAKELGVAIRKTIFLIRGKAVSNAPIKTGVLRGSIYTDFQPFRGEVGFNATYAGIVHEGSPPHVIRPKNKRALFWEGAAHPMAQVNHPGFRGNPYLKKAVDSSDEQVNKFFTDAVQAALDKISKDAS